MRGTITILKNFAFVGSAGQGFSTDWMAVPAYQNWRLVIEAKSVVTGCNLACAPDGTFDTDTSIVGSGSTTSFTGAGATVLLIVGGDMAPMIRFTMSATGASSVVLSVFLTPLQN